MIRYRCERFLQGSGGNRTVRAPDEAYLAVLRLRALPETICNQLQLLLPVLQQLVFLDSAYLHHCILSPQPSGFIHQSIRYDDRHQHHPSFLLLERGGTARAYGEGAPRETNETVKGEAEG